MQTTAMSLSQRAVHSSDWWDLAVHPAQCCAYHVAHVWTHINTSLKTLQKLEILLDCLREEDCSSMVRRKEEREEATRRRACAACTSRHCVSVV